MTFQMPDQDAIPSTILLLLLAWQVEGCFGRPTRRFIDTLTIMQHPKASGDSPQAQNPPTERQNERGAADRDFALHVAGCDIRSCEFAGRGYSIRPGRFILGSFN